MLDHAVTWAVTWWCMPQMQALHARLCLHFSIFVQQKCDVCTHCWCILLEQCCSQQPVPICWHLPSIIQILQALFEVEVDLCCKVGDFLQTWCRCIGVRCGKLAMDWLDVMLGGLDATFGALDV